MNKVSRIEIGLHIGIIATALMLLNYPGFDLTFGVFNSGDHSLLLPSILGTIVNGIIFYGISFYLIPKKLKNKGVLNFSMNLLMLLVLCTSIEIAIDSWIYSSSNILSEYAFSEIIILDISFNILVMIGAFAYRFSKDWFYNERQRREISERQLRTELEVLKNQINPHFLFNALNNLFSMALQNNDESTAEGISKLSEMMRYVFEKSDKESTSLQDEVNYINDYIYLQRLRFDNHVKVELDYDENLRHVKIAPMLLIPFIENAFKYGISSSKKTSIIIHLLNQNSQVEFKIENEIVQHERPIQSSGVGLANVKKRLELIYPNRHKLRIITENGKFMVKLTLDIL